MLFRPSIQFHERLFPNLHRLVVVFDAKAFCADKFNGFWVKNWLAIAPNRYNICLLYTSGGQGLSGRTRSDKDTYSGSYVSGIWFSSEVNGNVTFGDSGGGGAGGNGENGTNSSGSTSIIVRFNDSHGSSGETIAT